MRSDSGYSILEVEDLKDGVNLAEVNEALGQKGLEETFIVDTRFSLIDARSSGYNGNLMLYSSGQGIDREENASSILSDYFEQQDVTLNYVGEGFDNRYYDILNQ